MKVSELIEKLKTCDENLVISFKCPESVPDNIGFDVLGDYLVLNSVVNDNYIDTISVLNYIKELEKCSSQDLKIGLWDWEEVGLTIVGEYVFPVTANFTQQNENLILELEII